MLCCIPGWTHFSCAVLQGVDDDASIHDRVLWAIHMSGMDDLVKFLASSETEQQWSMHVLETVSLMFRDQVSGCKILLLL